MPRYIDADKLLTDEKTHTLPVGCGKASGNVVVFVDDIEKMPTADVVPKSEVARLQEDVDRLQEINNRQVENIKLAKAEVAREIFDDIKCSILAMSTLALFSYTDNLEESNAKQKCYKYVSELIDELDKRYAEGE